MDSNDPNVLTDKVTQDMINLGIDTDKPNELNQVMTKVMALWNKKLACTLKQDKIQKQFMDMEDYRAKKGVFHPKKMGAWLLFCIIVAGFATTIFKPNHEEITFLVAFCMGLALYFMDLKTAKDKVRQFEMDAKELIQNYNHLSGEITLLEMSSDYLSCIGYEFPEKYFNHLYLAKILTYMAEGRCDTVKEMINCIEADAKLNLALTATDKELEEKAKNPSIDFEDYRLVKADRYRKWCKARWEKRMTLFKTKREIWLPDNVEF